MKKITVAAGFLMIILLCFTSCSKTTNQIKRMQAQEEGVSSPSTIEEIKEAISKYEDRVNDIILAEQQTGIWWKMLGSRYIDNQMYGEALKAYQRAIEIYPANQNLYYYIGVCAGYLANSALDFDATGDLSKRTHYLELAESAYQRAIELEPRYARALYGLAVLYEFELGESEKAVPLLEKLLTIEQRHFEGMFVLARAYYSTYEFQKAADMYDRIISLTTADDLKAEAEANKKVVLDALYSGR